MIVSPAEEEDSRRDGLCRDEEEDLPYCAAFAIAERLSNLPHKHVIFQIAWRLRRPRR
jgi:hypothetical protein